MICPRCGRQTPDNNPRCINCGLQFQQAPRPQQPQQSQYQQQPQQPQYQPQPQQPQYQQPQYQQPQQPQYQPPQQPGAAQPSVPGKGLSIAGMVCGIVSLVFICTTWGSLIPAIVGVVLSAIGFSKAKKAGVKSGMATAGIVTSCVAIGIDIIASTIMTIVGFSALESLGASDIYDFVIRLFF
ncbi:MAG: DUF4190 domain-containing protein [Clostridia bacterium]|nr:DUF4190 domain-containing protein [Clostridia bacterium]